MSEFTSPLSAALPPIPDNQSIPQFFLDLRSPYQPLRPDNVPWLINDYTGQGVGHYELSRRTNAIAKALTLSWDMKEGDVACIFSPNCTNYPIAIWAIHRLGGVITPANPGYMVDELLHQLQISKASLLIIHPAFLDIARLAARGAGISDDRIVLIEKPTRPVPGHTSLEDLLELGTSTVVKFSERQFGPGEAKTALAFLSFSSGTTGKPKAVSISHFSVISNVIQMATHFRITDPLCKDKMMVPGDVGVAVLPFFHIYGLVVNLHFLLFCGMSIVVIPKFVLSSFLESIVRYRITHLCIVPPQVVLLCKDPSVKKYDFSHVKFCISGAAPLSGEFMQQLQKVIPNASIGQGYGLTETCASVAMIPPTQRVGTVGSAGQLIPGIVARVVKPDGSLASEGEQGELVVTGPSMSLGYFNNEAATKETFVDGWVRTGDEVIIRNMEVFVVDRLKEIIKVRGFQVAPAELEGHLLMHPDVADACVVSVPNEYSGELPMAYIVIRDKALQRIAGDKTAALRLKAVLVKHVAEAKVPYKHLKGGIEFIDAIPKNPSGKMLRRVLREQALRTVEKQPRARL